jgi:hypothetical protein
MKGKQHNCKKGLIERACYPVIEEAFSFNDGGKPLIDMQLTK